MTLIKAIKAKKLKITKARIAVATALEQAKTPLKIEALYASLLEPKPDLVTVYRILESFEKTGLVRQIDFRHGHAHYEWVAENHHHHMVCTICRTIYPLHDEEMELAIKKISQRNKKLFKITDHALEFFGTCSSCNNSV